MHLLQCTLHLQRTQKEISLQGLVELIITLYNSWNQWRYASNIIHVIDCCTAALLMALPREEVRPGRVALAGW